METKRIVVDCDDDDLYFLEKVKEILRAKHGNAVSTTFVFRTLLREYVAAKEQEQQ